MELAVVLPLLLVGVLGMVDLGRAAFEAIEIENAAHAGAAYGARSKGLADDQQGILQAALTDLGPDVDTSRVTVESERYCECSDGSEVDCSDPGGCGGDLSLIFVRVRVDKTFETLFPYPGMPNTIPLVREVQLRVR